MPLQGAADHLVSEAVYLADPEGNGLELYSDKPREEWPRRADGRVVMGTLALDAQGVLAEAGADWRGMRVGHVHLQVDDVAAAVAFYRDTLGLDLVERMGNEAAFLSAGGYHHHVGVNSWGTRGGPRASGTALGLERFTLLLPDGKELEAAIARLGTPSMRDPAGNALELAA